MKKNANTTRMPFVEPKRESESAVESIDMFGRCVRIVVVIDAVIVFKINYLLLLIFSFPS